MPPLKVRRRTLACARCRKRKLACDGKTPACSRCLNASVPCVGFESATQSIVPRSIAQHLETTIARLESVSKAGNSTVNRETPCAKATFANSVINSLTNETTPTFLGVTGAVPIFRCAVAATRIPTARKPSSTTDLDENHPRSIINPTSESVTLGTIPHSVADFLFQNYLTRAITHYPIFHTSDVLSAFNRVYVDHRNGSEYTARDLYTISLIMSISLSTAARNKQARANSIASNLFHNALQYIPEVFTNDLQGLQSLLLLTQYTFFNPSVANLWLLTGFISQACIDLGLHQELPIASSVTAFERDLRRRIFWCAFEMEVATCSAFSRPMSLPIDDCDVAFPLEIEDNAIRETGIDNTARISKFTSRRIWLLRKIEAHVLAVLYQHRKLPQGYSDVRTWMKTMDKASTEWNQEVHTAAAANTDESVEVQWKEIMLYADIGHPYILVILYRPTPLVKEPSNDNLMKAFTAAVQVADGYWKQSNADFGNTKYVFHPCHHSFSAAIVFLQALQRCKAEISETYTLEQVEGYMAVFSRFFSTIAERWPAASRCLEEYERLLAPVKKEYIDYIVQKASQIQSPTPDTIYDLFENTMNFDEVFGLWAGLDPVTAQNETFGLSSLAPHDWNAEFDFGMDMLP